MPCGMDQQIKRPFLLLSLEKIDVNVSRSTVKLVVKDA